MRTTIDLPEDLHRTALLIARDRRQTLSRTVADLLRAALAAGQGEVVVTTDPVTGLPLVPLGRRITAEDVASASDEG
jgi:predicted nucleic acid-binding protein